MIKKITQIMAMKNLDEPVHRAARSSDQSISLGPICEICVNLWIHFPASGLGRGIYPVIKKIAQIIGMKKLDEPVHRAARSSHLPVSLGPICEICVHRWIHFPASGLGRGIYPVIKKITQIMGMKNLDEPVHRAARSSDQSISLGLICEICVHRWIHFPASGLDEENIRFCSRPGCVLRQAAGRRAG